MDDERTRLLDRWAYSIMQAAQTGALDHGRPIAMLGKIGAIHGPRCGALEFHCGLDTGRMLDVMTASDFALAAQFVPWHFGRLAVYRQSRFVRFEAEWPEHLQERDIRLADIGQYPKHGGKWIAGKNELGRTVTLHIGDDVPHYLWGGWTGSGKSFALRSALAQLSQDSDNRLVLIDGKFGDGLGCLGHLPGIVGPVAVDTNTARGALAWAVIEMRRRYETGDKCGRVIVCIDELQEFCGKSGDALIIEMVRRLATQGRGANIHLFLGTQNPTSGAFSDLTIRRNLPGRWAGKTENAKASEVVIGGSTPRADWLCGAGDCYAITPSATQRAQTAYIPSQTLEAMNTCQPTLAQWPEADAEAVGTLPESSPRWEYDGDELAVSLVTVSKSDKAGRGALRDELELAGLGRPGSERVDRLLELGRDMRTWLVINDFSLPACQKNAHPADYEIMENGLVVSTPLNQAGRRPEGKR